MTLGELKAALKMEGAPDSALVVFKLLPEAVIEIESSMTMDNKGRALVLDIPAIGYRLKDGIVGVMFNELDGLL